MTVKIGVLGIQGDVAENIASTEYALKVLGQPGEVVVVKTSKDIRELDGLIIPGGESTVIGQLSLPDGILEKIKKENKERNMPIFGICAGLILLSKNAADSTVKNNEQPLLSLLDVEILRNAFGRQRESFQTDLDMKTINIPRFNGVFIRAPSIIGVGQGVDVICALGENDNKKIVAVKQGNNILGTSFHPELTSDVSLHKYFINMVISSKAKE